MKQHIGKSVWPSGYKTRTFRFGPALLEDFYATADRLQVNPSDLACYLLREALDQIQTGKLQVPTMPIGALIADPRARE